MMKNKIFNFNQYIHREHEHCDKKAIRTKNRNKKKNQNKNACIEGLTWMTLLCVIPNNLFSANTHI